METITRAERTHLRADGSECRIVALAMYGTGLYESVDIMVFRRDSADEAWSLCSNRPDPDWRAIPVDDYVTSGRSQALSAASPGEILAVASLIGQPLCEAA